MHRSAAASREAPALAILQEEYNKKTHLFHGKKDAKLNSDLSRSQAHMVSRQNDKSEFILFQKPFSHQSGEPVRFADGHGGAE